MEYSCPTRTLDPDAHLGFSRLQLTSVHLLSRCDSNTKAPILQTHSESVHVTCPRGSFQNPTFLRQTYIHLRRSLQERKAVAPSSSSGGAPAAFGWRMKTAASLLARHHHHHHLKNSVQWDYSGEDMWREDGLIQAD